MEFPVAERLRELDGIPNWLFTLLDQTGVHYEVIAHRRDVTAVEAASDTSTPRLEFAKTVVVRAGGDEVLAILPAHQALCGAVECPENAPVHSGRCLAHALEPCSARGREFTTGIKDPEHQGLEGEFLFRGQLGEVLTDVGNWVDPRR
jgi:hypothetical protein